ncbi:hypothetical protein A9Q81_17550 [Gammaproteobacteria bacterium 42_54_T18]|nr:hypothetical protein A9Q81_17550 [Gammaproteobacteria bacterium 42_54_T18]
MDHQLPNVSDSASQFDVKSSSNSIRKLLSLPHVLLPVLHLSSDTPNDPLHLYNLLRYDASLVARVLEVNRKSPSATLSTSPQADIKELLLSTSPKTIRSLVLSTFHDRNGIYTCGNALSQEYLKKQWLTSIQCGFLAKSLALQVDYPDPEEAYFAGLLHNIGQLIFHAEDGDEYLNTCVYDLAPDLTIGDKSSLLLSNENKRFSIDHCKIGAHMCKTWGLPIQLQDAIRFHHASFEQISDAHILTRIINLSSAISEGKFSQFRTCATKVSSLLNIPIDHIAPVIESAIAQTSDIIRSLDIPLTDSIIDQKLVPIHDNESDHVPLQDAIKLNQLTREIHFCGILETVKGALLNATSEEHIQYETQLAAATLFDVEKTFFFTFDKSTNYIQGDQKTKPPSIINDLSILSEKGRSILADTAISNESLDTFSISYETLSIVDQEILHQASAQHLLCQPLMNGKKLFGILVFALNDKEMLQLSSTRKHVKDFTATVSRALLRVKHNTEQFDSMLHAERSLYQTKLKRMTHEINNPLSIAQNHLHILSMSDHYSSQQRESIQVIQEEIIRASNLLKQHVDGSHSQNAKNHAVNINEILCDLLLVFEDGLTEEQNIDTERQLDKSMPAIFIDDIKLKQILTNLLKNAFESLGNEGWLSIRSQDNVIINGEPFIEIQIADDGPGIPKSIIGHLFSPINTLKGEDHSGIGLSIVKELTNQLDGCVSYRREFDGTTVFSLFFPRKFEI